MPSPEAPASLPSILEGRKVTVEDFVKRHGWTSESTGGPQRSRPLLPRNLPGPTQGSKRPGIHVRSISGSVHPPIWWIGGSWIGVNVGPIWWIRIDPPNPLSWMWIAIHIGCTEIYPASLDRTQRYSKDRLEFQFFVEFRNATSE